MQTNPTPSTPRAPRGARFYALAIVRSRGTGTVVIDGWYLDASKLADDEIDARRFNTLPESLAFASTLDAGADRVAVPFEVILV